MTPSHPPCPSVLYSFSQLKQTQCLISIICRSFKTSSIHCKWRAVENQIYSKCLVPIYVFPEMKLRGIIIPLKKCSVSQFPYSFICVIYKFPGSICLFCCSQISWEYINRSKIHECKNWERGEQFHFWEFINRIFSTAFASLSPSSKESGKNFL